MKNGLKKKMIAFLLSALLVMNLVLIPNLDSFASNISAETDFSYVYEGYTYGFYVYDNIPSGYTFNSDVIEYVISTSADGFKYQLSNNIGIYMNRILSSYVSWVYTLMINAHIALNKQIANWVTSSNYVYSWRFEGTGIDPNYPGHELYGPAYGFHFDGCLFEEIDLVLDQNGNFYGSEYIGNYTYTDISDESDYISVHQVNPSEDEMYISQSSGINFYDLKQPYFEGKDLYFWYTESGVEHSVKITNFVNSIVGMDGGSFSIQTSHLSDHTLYIDGVAQGWDITGSGNWFYYNDIQYGQEVGSKFKNIQYSNCPSFNFKATGYSRFDSNYNIFISPRKGVYNSQVVNGSTPSLFLTVQSYTPIIDPDPVDPGTIVPVDDVPINPDDDLPISDPDPVPGIDYPEPEPIPIPVPPLPPIVSGNDDLWPDMNGFFDAENDLDGFLGPLRNFEFGSFSNVTSQFSAALVWVSTIMMTLFDGSDFNILFSILAVFFIACALLGIYKWWNS